MLQLNREHAVFTAVSFKTNNVDRFHVMKSDVWANTTIKIPQNSRTASYGWLVQTMGKNIVLLFAK